MPPRPLPREIDVRVALTEQRQDGQAAELQRVRDRLHVVESDRAAVQLCIQGLDQLRQWLDELRKGLDQLRHDLPAIATAAAKEAVQLALEHRDEEEREARQEHRADRGLFLQHAGAGLGIAGFAFGLLTFFFH